MTIEELARLVKSMRDTQKAYFRERTPTKLRESKDAEWRIDATVKEILDPPQPGLFDGEGQG